MKCNHCHKEIDEKIYLSLQDFNGNDWALTNAVICPQCSNQLRDWLWQGEDLKEEQ